MNDPIVKTDKFGLATEKAGDWLGGCVKEIFPKDMDKHKCEDSEAELDGQTMSRQTGQQLLGYGMQWERVVKWVN